MNDIFEWFFCPVHGLFRPDNWVFIPLAISGGLYAVKSCWYKVVNKLK
jgi:hypothetical protein